MKTLSNITHKYYINEDCVFYRNPVQAAYFVFRGAKLVDLFVNDKLLFTFVFRKEDHERLKHEWRLREH